MPSATNDEWYSPKRAYSTLVKEMNIIDWGQNPYQQLPFLPRDAFA